MSIAVKDFPDLSCDIQRNHMKKQRRPPPGQMYQADDPDFVARLSAYVKGPAMVESAPALARRVEAKTGYLPHDSLIRKMAAGVVPTSKMVAPICDTLGWPYPPPANSKELWLSLGEELRRDSPPDYERLVKALESRVAAVRAEKERP